ncbi:MAG: LON peptidase substrate-binding domain-containing protein [Gammaproteobacteria bacterium]
MSAIPLTGIALFPLRTVLFPGGALPLRIFEPRYVDMVRDCLRDDRRFCVVPIRRGQEAGAPAEYYPSGVLAYIESWDQGADGLLHLVARGAERVRVSGDQRRGDGLVVATLESCPDQLAAVPPEFAFLGKLLDAIYAEHPQLAPTERPREPDAAWLAYRLAELLPLGIRAALDILDLDLPALKLARVAAFVATREDPDEDPTSH